MKYVEVVADEGHVATVSAIAEQLEVPDFRLGTLDEDGMQQMRYWFLIIKFKKR